MSTTTTHPLAQVAKECGLEETHHLVAACLPFYEKAHPLVEQAKAIVVTDATQVSLMKQAGKVRKEMKVIRVAADKARKAMKEDAQRTVTATDRVFGAVIKGLEAEEARLEEQEKFAERAEAAQKAKIRAERTASLSSFGPIPQGYILEDMTDESFGHLLESSREAHRRQLELANDAEQRRRAEEIEQKQREAELRAENERLRKEREQADAERKEAERVAKAQLDAIEAEARKQREAAAAQAKAEREAAEAEARREREAREKLERERRDADLKAEQEEAERARARAAAEAAPDREKIIALADQVMKLRLPPMTSAAGKLAEVSITAEIEALAVYIADVAASLGGAA